MPYIIARSFCQFPGREVAFRHGTFIDCHVDQGELATLDALMGGLGARRNGFTITVTQPPDLVLIRLENLGYKVVGTNTTDHIVIWTLHKQA